MVRLIAAAMAAANTSVWVVVSAWERPGTTVRPRVRLRAPRAVGLAFDASLYASLVYPFLAVAAPRWTLEGWANWSSSRDRVLGAIGLASWAVGMAVLVWGSRAMGRHLAIDGVAEDHELVTSGPYRYVRHPVYASFVAIALGTALVLRSYALLPMAVVLMVTGRWWADAEEELLASSQGFGARYRAYAARTGRFLPGLGRPRGKSGRRRSN